MICKLALVSVSYSCSLRSHWHSQGHLMLMSQLRKCTVSTFGSVMHAHACWQLMKIYTHQNLIEWILLFQSSVCVTEAHYYAMLHVTMYTSNKYVVVRRELIAVYLVDVWKIISRLCLSIRLDHYRSSDHRGVPSIGLLPLQWLLLWSSTHQRRS